MNEREIFIAALQQSDDDNRAALLDHACGADEELRQRVDALLLREKELGSFLEHPAADPAATEATATFTTPSEEPGTSIGRYKLMEQIGEGGMGVVYVADQKKPVRRRVALKIIKPGMDSKQVIARFEAERQALALMDHPHVAKVIDAGSTDTGRPYFVMELIRGIPITEYCDQMQMNLRARLELFANVCSAVKHAHLKGIIHRDIKPSNVLVTEIDGKPIPKVIDFGVAKATNQQLTEQTIYTQFSQLVGTPLYMSPEQAGVSGVDVDTRSDVYSLGVLLYELLTGTTPFDKDTLKKAGYDEMRRMIREEEPPRPSTRFSTLKAADSSTISERRGVEPRRLNQIVQGELDWIVMKALEKDRNRRYESASAFAADIERYLNDEAVEASPASWSYRFSKFLRRNRSRVALFAVAASFLFALAVVVGVMVFNRQAASRLIVQQTRQTLAGAEAAMDAGDLDLAGEKLAEARGRLSDKDGQFPQLVTEIDRLQQGIQERLDDQQRFDQFIALADDAKSKMAFSYKNASGDSLARQALDLYGVLTNDSWNENVDGLHLTSEQKNELRERIYQTLVGLADFGVRWKEAEPKAYVTSLELLEQAQAFHEPTRAFYFVRSECSRKQGKKDAADEDVKRYRQTEAKTAWDYYLPGHTMGWRGDLEEAIRSYQAALRIQPNNYNALFFLADRLASKKINRQPEAIQLYQGCMALRPDHIHTYLSRAELYEDLEDYEAAEADLSAAIERTPESEQAYAYNMRADFYKRRGQMAKERSDREDSINCWRQELDRLASKPEVQSTLLAMNRLALNYSELGQVDKAIPIFEELIKRRKAISGIEHLDTLRNMRNLGVTYSVAKQFDKAIPLLKETLDELTRLHGAENEYTLKTMHDLGLAYFYIKQFDKAIPLFEDALDKQTTRLGRDHASTLKTMNNLGVAYGKLGQFDKAIELLEEAVQRFTTKLGTEHPETLNSVGNLAGTYGDAERFDEAHNLYQKWIDSGCADGAIHYQHAMLCLREQNQSSYRKSCEDMLAQFASTTNPIDSYWVAWTCVLAPNAVDDNSAVLQHAKKAVETESENEKYRGTLGAAQFRDSQYEKALKTLTDATNGWERTDSSAAYFAYFRAMTEYQLNREEVARESLAEANKMADAELNDTGNPPSWNRKLTLQLLRKEAESLVTPADDAVTTDTNEAALTEQ